MLQYYICLGVVLTGILVLELGLGFGIILYFVIGTRSNAHFRRSALSIASPSPTEEGLVRETKAEACPQESTSQEQITTS